MTKYKLLKDLPWCKAGEIFERKDDKFTLPHAPDMYTSDIKSVDEWFEKVKQLTINDIDWNYIPKKGESYYYAIDNDYAICNGIVGREIYDAHPLDKAMILVGNCFKTEEEAKAYAEWLKAVAELRRSSDYKPDMSYNEDSKLYVRDQIVLADSCCALVLGQVFNYLFEQSCLRLDSTTRSGLRLKDGKKIILRGN